MTFERWTAKVDRLLEKATGYTSEDFPMVAFYCDYAEGTTPADEVKSIVKTYRYATSVR